MYFLGNVYLVNILVFIVENLNVTINQFLNEWMDACRGCYEYWENKKK